MSDCKQHVPFVPRYHTPENPPRCKRPDETARQYRVAMGWDEPLTDEQIMRGVEALGGSDLWQVVGAYFRAGVRFAENAHGLGKTAQDGA